MKHPLKQQLTTRLKNSLEVIYNFSDDVREDQPRIVMISEYIDAVRKLTVSDHHVMYDEIETIFEYFKDLCSFI